MTPGADHRAPASSCAPKPHRDAGEGTQTTDRDRPAVLSRTSWPRPRPGSSSSSRCCALLATFAQINPIWQYGPYTPVAISSASQPDFYMGFLEGSLRMMPAWEWNFLGHTVSFSVLIPFAIPFGIIFGGAAFWPFFEQWATGDRSYHHVNDRPQERAHPDRYRHSGGGVLRRAVGRGRERRHRGQGCRSRCTRSPGSRGCWSSWDRRSRFTSPDVSAWVCSVRTRSCSSTGSRPASSGRCPTASSSRSTGRWTRRSGPSSRPRRCPRSCPRPGRRTRTACPRRR